MYILYILFFLIGLRNGNDVKSNHKHRITNISNINNPINNNININNPINNQNIDDGNKCITNSSKIICTKIFKDSLKKIEEAMELKSIPGMTISVVYPDQNNQLQVWTKALGYREMENEKKKVHLDTKFAIGSLSKAFTTTLLCILLHEQKVKLVRSSRYLNIYLFI